MFCELFSQYLRIIFLDLGQDIGPCKIVYCDIGIIAVVVVQEEEIFAANTQSFILHVSFKRQRYAKIKACNGAEGCFI